MRKIFNLQILKERMSGKDEQLCLIGSSALICHSGQGLERIQVGHSKGGRSSSNG